MQVQENRAMARFKVNGQVADPDYVYDIKNHFAAANARVAAINEFEKGKAHAKVMHDAMVDFDAEFGPGPVYNF